VMFHNSADVFLACLSCTLAPCDQHRRPAGGARRADRVGLSAGEREAIAYLIDENRLLRRQLDGPRLRLTDADRRRLAARAHRVGRAAPRAVATIVTADTLRQGHRQLIAREWTFASKSGRRGLVFTRGGRQGTVRCFPPR